MSIQIDYVVDDGGDWEGVYLNASLVHEGHSTPSEVWLKLLSEVAYQSVETRKWTTSMEDGDRYPSDMLDLTVDKDRYKLMGDSCLI